MSMKKSINIWSALTIAAALTAGFTACSNEDNILEEQQQDAQAQVYHFSIPASFDAGTNRAMSFDNSGETPTCTSTFATTEKVYVYNKTKSTMLGNYLTPSNLSNDDKNCDLTGDLTGTIAENDELWLLYNADYWGSFYYSDQNGKESGVTDGAKAVVTVSATSPLTTSFAHFTNVQSMFRFKFEDENSNAINVSLLTIYTTNPAIARDYDGTRSTGGYNIGNMIISPSPATSDYLYAGICFNPSHKIDGNKMVFLASDGTYLYRGKKAEPAAGFANGKYYYNTAPIQLTKEGALQTPTITWTTPSSSVEPDKTYCYRVIEENSEISLSGTSFGYDFNFGNNATGTTVHLNNLTATRFEDYFIMSYDWPTTITLDLTGTNSIACDDADCCVFSLDNLKLQGNGTLTVTSKNAEYCGLYGGDNYNESNNANATTTVLDVSTQLAADGYRVVRSARTDNQDGTYTWTYTVAPASEYPANVTLSTMYSTDGNGKKYYAARDGQTLTGNFGGSEGYITIADGATVTLNIEGFWAPNQCDHAPIHCLGDANIILADGMNANVSAGNDSNYPVVFVPEGKTMTISGTGKLIADGEHSNAAGIGGGYNITGGNIVIAGGIISAYGAYDSAAIGSSSSSSCGNITISGGAIKEARYPGAGDSSGAGIGSGASGSCGTITISGGQIGGVIGGWPYDGAVGSQYAAGIGSGQGGSCGTITIGADITYVRVSSNSDSHHLIGGEGPNSCDVYFGDFKVYDKNVKRWYNNSTGAYGNYFFPFDGNYGGLTFEYNPNYWILTPVTP